MQMKFELKPCLYIPLQHALSSRYAPPAYELLGRTSGKQVNMRPGSSAKLSSAI